MISCSTSNAMESLSRANDRRSEQRVVTVYRPCCLRAGARCTAGLIRNVSDRGLMIETPLEAAIGSDIEYLDGANDWRRARVVWVKGHQLGLENLDLEHSHPRFPPRPVRIPATLLAQVWIEDGPVEVGIGNISQTGALIFGIQPLARGRLLTLTVEGIDYPQTSVRWWAEGCAGLQFSRPIPLSRLSALVEHTAQRAAAMRYESCLGDLLEVMPANDLAREN